MPSGVLPVVDRNGTYVLLWERQEYLLAQLRDLGIAA